jgi:hypothetical protein
MSSSFVIPLSALFDQDGDILVEFGTERMFYAEPGYDFAGNTYTKRIMTALRHYIRVRGERFDVHPVFKKEEDGSETLDSVTFSGFHSTCVKLQELLEISVDID